MTVYKDLMKNLLIVLFLNFIVIQPLLADIYINTQNIPSHITLSGEATTTIRLLNFTELSQSCRLIGDTIEINQINTSGGISVNQKMDPLAFDILLPKDQRLASAGQVSIHVHNFEAKPQSIQLICQDDKSLTDLHHVVCENLDGARKLFQQLSQLNDPHDQGKLDEISGHLATVKQSVKGYSPLTKPYKEYERYLRQLEEAQDRIKEYRD